jgi:hypothetical protein
LSVPETETDATPLPEVPPKPKRGRKKKIPAPPVKTEADPTPPPSLLYDLCGLVSHKGESLSQGHYISYVKAEEGWTQVAEKKGGDGNPKEPTAPPVALSTETPAKRRRSSELSESAAATPEVGAEKRGRGRPKLHPKPADSFPPPRPPDTWVK